MLIPIARVIMHEVMIFLFLPLLINLYGYLNKIIVYIFDQPNEVFIDIDLVQNDFVRKILRLSLDDVSDDLIQFTDLPLIL